MPTPSWRSGETVARLNRLDRPGFAAEFLRRNSEYHKDCREARRLVAQGSLDVQAARDNLTRRWGLCFCL